MDYSTSLCCSLCTILFDSDPSKVKNPDNRLPLVCSTLGCWKTVCLQCVSRIRKGYILWKYVSDKIECPHCKQYGFNIRAPIVCRELCDIIQRIETSGQERADTERASVVSLSPPRVLKPASHISGRARISRTPPLDQNYQESPVLGPRNPLPTASTASDRATEYQKTNSPKKPTEKIKYNRKRDRVITHSDVSNKRKRFAEKGQEMENEKGGDERWVPRYEIGTRIRRVSLPSSVSSYDITSKFY